jgi:hypothetical protein
VSTPEAGGYVVAGAALVVLVGAIWYSKRQSGTIGAPAATDTDVPAGVNA